MHDASLHYPVHLFLILISVLVDDVVEAELVDTLAGADNTEPVPELLLLQEFLRPADRVNDCPKATRSRVSV